MLSTFIIALREGLEAALIVGILAAYIIKTNNRSLLRPLWLGVGAALVLSLSLGAILTFTAAELSDRGNEMFAGTTSFIAVGLVTWMVFWMKRTARVLKSELHGKVDTALTTGPLTLAGVAFFAVLREGLETSLFVYANFRTVDGKTSATIGLLLGFAIAIHTDPELLLVDEILAVGDAPFQKKCLDRIKQMQNEGRSIILVTHDTSTVENFCDSAVVLDHGKLLAQGETKSVIAAYQALP